MSLNSPPPTSSSTPLPESHFQLIVHTRSVNALAERLFQGQINQKDYDAQIYSTSIASTDKAICLPITMTLDDSLATLLAHANRRFGIPPAKAQTIKMYVLSSAKTVHAVGGHTLPGFLLLLDQDTLKMILTIMKESSLVEQLFVEFEN